MDQPTPDDPTPRPAAPGTNPGLSPVAASRRDQFAEARLHTLIGRRRPLVTWTRGWVSREVRAHRLLAARTLDFAVLTESDLALCSMGFFTRRPRLLVYERALAEIDVVEHQVPAGRRLLIESPDDPHPWRIELGENVRANNFADALIAYARAWHR
jgi:hypothetical protein